ncbi:coiled-coil and C2 domain-containing protein 1B isoform X2 [Denticeps clupeoides]|uniref:Coiled-coil and C2 domain-containing protein 1B n=1 Tax=Denticeps clupeoides TaxID=299321 RepID=A0AAY4ANZ1_9TELE|nr:coiled-coil and C2 domain-containing protein 1B-like isoform X2 [Denticeps clupeoides]
MFGKKQKRTHVTKGQGAAAAKQMGLYLDFNPNEMMDMDLNFDDSELQAEFAAITGNKAAAAGKPKKSSKAPLPMEDIEKMAAACMKDSDDEEEDDNLEDDEDLMAELQEVVGEEETDDSGADTSTTSIPIEAHTAETVMLPQQVPSVPGSLEHTLEERIAMYKKAVANAKASGESSKCRRYDRGLKTLLGMQAAARKGKQIEASEIPPPVACSTNSTAAGTNPATEQAESDSAVETLPLSLETSPLREEEPASSSTESGASKNLPMEETLVKLQRDYKAAAVKAKQAGNIDLAKTCMKTMKRMDAMIDAMQKGEPVDTSSLPPCPFRGSELCVAEEAVSSGPRPAVPASQAFMESVPQAGPPQPKNVLHALEQRLAKYQETYSQAKASDDSRKARMYERITKQYQSAIRAHKAGRAVNYQELPVPPGFPPIPGQEAAANEQGFAAVLDAANKLASEEAGGAEDEEEEEEEKKEAVKVKPSNGQKKPIQAVPMIHIDEAAPSSPVQSPKKESIHDKAVQQLEDRKKQYLKAAVQAKQKKDLEQAKQYLCTAKGFDAMIQAARNGNDVDISKLPPPLGEEEEDFIMVQHNDSQVAEKAEEIYAQLTKNLNEQYEKCTTYSKQFTHLGNITETTKFEKMAESCKKSLEMVKQYQARGLDPPKHHFESRTYNTVRIFPELSSTDMVVTIVRGINLPATQGIAAKDLSAFVKFEFPYPSSDQPQKHKTTVIKSTNNPDYNQSFTLNINRNHRGFKRVMQSKGLKLEVFQKGGFLRSDKPLGTAHLKLEKLEGQSEVREIVEVMDGRKLTGGRLEVKVRLREPLTGQDLQSTTENWLVLESTQLLL